jgi:hypothetical protein
MFQRLDLLLFRQLKDINTGLSLELSRRRDLDHVMGMFRAHELTPTSLSIRSSWKKPGLGSSEAMR